MKDSKMDQRGCQCVESFIPFAVARGKWMVVTMKSHEILVGEELEMEVVFIQFRM